MSEVERKIKMKTVLEFALKVKEAGGVLYDVGGGVRDDLLGIPSKDRDYCVTGFTPKSFKKAFPDAQQVIGQDGKKTVYVFLVEITGVRVEVALARKEIKTGSRHGDYEYEVEGITIETDLYRRDVTINSIARNVLTGEYIDPYGGIEDLKNGIIRATSDAFYEDALRVYRVAVRHAKTGFVVEERTKEMMKKASLELPDISSERVVEELKKAYDSPAPDKFFRLLQELDILHIHFPHLAGLYGVPQPPEHHPEGHTFEHTMRTIVAMKKLSSRYEDMYSISFHDVGKKVTPKELLPKHHGHEEAGVPLVEEMSKSLGVPTSWRKAALYATKYHGKFHRLGEIRDIKIVDFLVEAEKTPLKVEGLAKVALADARGKKDPDATHPYYDFALRAIQEISKVKGNKELEGIKARDDKRRRQAVIIRKLKKEFGFVK